MWNRQPTIASLFAGMVLLAFPAGGLAAPQLATVSVAVAPALTPAVLASIVADSTSAYSVVTGSETVAINNSSHPGASTDARAMGAFTGGNVTPGTSLDDPIDPTAAFAGGIGMDSGVTLCSGFLSDGEPTRPPGFAAEVGVEGANNGQPIDTPANEGEISKEFQASDPFNDEDWAAVHADLTSNSGDPAVLQFDIDLENPGFLRVSFAFGSDEYPAWINQEFNDTIAILVKGPCTPTGNAGENLATFVQNGVPEKFSLHDLAVCDELFRKNQMSPAALNAFPGSTHQITDPPNYYTFYDHEFGGFSKVLTRETSTALAPGRYTVKFVIEDVADRIVDSALFIPQHSVKLFALAQGDYDGDGYVDKTDYKVWREHFGKTPATFYDGDGNGDCIVDAADYVLWRANENQTGNADFSADFDRNGCVDGDDFLNWQLHTGMSHCASRFEGDADGDGDVDNDDLTIWQNQVGSCSGGNAPMNASGGSASLTKGQIPSSPDTNGDGVVDETDLAALDQIILGSGSQSDATSQSDTSSTNPQLEPTLAEPQP